MNWLSDFLAFLSLIFLKFEKLRNLNLCRIENLIKILRIVQKFLFLFSIKIYKVAYVTLNL